jgi:hypothetical protein
MTADLCHCGKPAVFRYREKPTGAMTWLAARLGGRVEITEETPVSAKIVMKPARHH